MNTRYCEKCGTKHSYTIDIPRFCNQCGSPFDKNAIAFTKLSTPKQIMPKRHNNVEDDGSDEDTDKEVPQITKIEVEIEVNPTPKISFANAKNAGSFARDKVTKSLTESDLTSRLDSLFERDRQDQKDKK